MPCDEESLLTVLTPPGVSKAVKRDANCLLPRSKSDLLRLWHVNRWAAEKSLRIFSEYASTISDTLPGGPVPFYLLTDMLTEAWGQHEGSKRSGVSLTGQEAQIQPANVSKCSCSRWRPFRKMTLLLQKTYRLIKVSVVALYTAFALAFTGSTVCYHQQQIFEPGKQ